MRADVTKRMQEAYLAQHEADERGDLQEGWRPVKTDDGRCEDTTQLRMRGGSADAGQAHTRRIPGI